MKNNVTFVTGIWDMGRDQLTDGFGRPFSHYLERFERLLNLNINLVVFGPKQLENIVLARSSRNRTFFKQKELSDFDSWFPFFDKVDQLRTSSEWLYDQPTWLYQSPQAALKYYNPVIMSKFFMLNDAMYFDGHASDYYFWIDGGLINTVPAEKIVNANYTPEYLKANNAEDKLLFLSFDYQGSHEIHGFKREGLETFCGKKTTRVPRGGFFGGRKDIVRSFNPRYYDHLSQSLHAGYMGTEESVFCILDAKYPEDIHHFNVDGGALYPFFNHLQQHQVPEETVKVYDRSFDQLKTAIYILTFNSPEQTEWLLRSFELADPNFIIKPDIFLIDNSTNKNTTLSYQKLCKQYGITYLKQKENIGITGGRLFAAKHFHQNDYDYYLFFEDDMMLHAPSYTTCNAGYPSYKTNLFNKTLHIIHEEKYDFLKLSFSEFYGTNKKQWAWYNIDDHIREKWFPDHPTKHNYAEAPETIFGPKKSYQDVDYMEGECYYCNWPLWFSREGNYKVFIEPGNSYPSEQWVMKNTFYLQREGYVKAAILQLSPINHYRFAHYEQEERKEV
jgi:hypothetical protein